MKENSLIEIKKGLFSKIINYFKKLFGKNTYENLETENTNEDNVNQEIKKELEGNLNKKIDKDQQQEIEDFKILEKIINGELESKSLDDETKKRIIRICKIRLSQINQKIKEKTIEEENLKKYLETESI